MCGCPEIRKSLEFHQSSTAVLQITSKYNDSKQQTFIMSVSLGQESGMALPEVPNDLGGYIYFLPTDALHRATQGFPCGSDGKASAYTAGDLGLSPALGRSSGEGNGNPLQFSCLENPIDGGARQATVHGVTKSQT